MQTIPLETSQELRLFFFTLPMLKSIQHGIQAGHAAVNLMKKYCAPTSRLFEEEAPSAFQKMVAKWADEDETFILLNPGNFKKLQEVSELIRGTNLYPWAAFYEDADSLDGLQTAIAVLLPKSVFGAKPVWKTKPDSKDRYIDCYRFEDADLRLDVTHRIGTLEFTLLQQWLSKSAAV